MNKGLFDQGTLTAGEGLVQFTSSLKQVVVKIKNTVLF
jgi:hypothetical protein